MLLINLSMKGKRSLEINDLAETAEKHSDKALYPYLSVHILAPFEGDCIAFAAELRNRLKEEGFESAAIASDMQGSPPDYASPEEKKEYWYEKSETFLQQADVAIFLFLDYIFERPYLPEDAREESHDPRSDPKEINSSVSVELDAWLREYGADGDRSLALFEGEMANSMGSLIQGGAEATGTAYDDFEANDIDGAFQAAKTKCRNWAMGELHDALQDRYIRRELIN